MRAPTYRKLSRPVRHDEAEAPQPAADSGPGQFAIVSKIPDDPACFEDLIAFGDLQFAPAAAFAEGTDSPAPAGLDTAVAQERHFHGITGFPFSRRSPLPRLPAADSLRKQPNRRVSRRRTASD